jgi:hypothetical protein
VPPVTSERSECTHIRPPGDPGYVRYDGSGLRDDGYYCTYIPATRTCDSDLVILGAAGIYRYYESVLRGQMCATLSNVLYFDGTGLKVVSISGVACLL